ncbi:MAG: adenylosuccinate lyase family protein [Alphaproteobacteria bacterium]|nr:adenylosuccinate lyase family protein [Alphaproteobacteria bacterium]
MPSSLIDSTLYRDMFGAEAMRRVFCDEGRLQAWLDTEAALARAQGKLGIIPAEAAAEISARAKVENLDQAAIKAEFDRVGFPILPMVHALQKAVSEQSRRYVHWGSTTQDIIDTGLVLQIRAGLALLDAELAAIEAALAKLVAEHRDTVMAGRTFGQQAIPVTFGYKAAIWLDETMRHRARLAAMRPRVLVVECGGAVGTLASMGADGLKVRAAIAAELGLGEPEISWHVARDRIAEVGSLLAMVTATLAKIGGEIAALMRTEIGELAEPAIHGRGASSTLPQKRNPILASPLWAIARRVRMLALNAVESMEQEHERGNGPMFLEWGAMPEAFVFTAGALAQARFVLEGLEVDARQMRRNLDLTGGAVMAEAIMMGLAPVLGRGRAHDLVYEVCRRAAFGEITVKAGLLAVPEIAAAITPEKIDALLDPSGYLGTCRDMADRVLAAWRKRGA